MGRKHLEYLPVSDNYIQLEIESQCIYPRTTASLQRYASLYRQQRLFYVLVQRAVKVILRELRAEWMMHVCDSPVSAWVCTWVWVLRPEENVGVGSNTLPYSTDTGLSLKLKSFILVLATELPESAIAVPSAGVTNTHVHIRLFLHGLGIWTQNYRFLYSRQSYLRRTPPSLILNDITS